MQKVAFYGARLTLTLSVTGIRYPFCAAKGLKVENILTDNGKEFCGGGSDPYRLYLELNDLEQRTTQTRRPRDEFFREAFGGKLYESVEALQQDLDEWLLYHNTERTHQGYRNVGRRPIERI